MFACVCMCVCVYRYISESVNNKGPLHTFPLLWTDMKIATATLSLYHYTYRTSHRMICVYYIRNIHTHSHYHRSKYQNCRLIYKWRCGGDETESCVDIWLLFIARKLLRCLLVRPLTYSLIRLNMNMSSSHCVKFVHF